MQYVINLPAKEIADRLSKLGNITDLGIDVYDILGNISATLESLTDLVADLRNKCQ